VRIYKNLTDLKNNKHLFHITSTLNRNASNYNLWMGREVALQIRTSFLKNPKKFFYTDSNGMDIVKRIYISQGDITSNHNSPRPHQYMYVDGKNYYPVSTFLFAYDSD
jgi:hypothetical protein